MMLVSAGVEGEIDNKWVGPNKQQKDKEIFRVDRSGQVLESTTRFD